MKKLVILVILISISAMPAYSMMEITVEAENPVKAYTRVLGQEELNLLKPADTADAIKSLTEINVISRGLGTVQGDIIISAGTYEQAAVTLDGVRINDPQTGHYSADIPVTSLDTASVSINTGAAASGFGAFTGSVGVETRGAAKDEIRLKGEYGTYNIWLSALSAAKTAGDFYASISVEKTGSDGYRKETDFMKNTVFFKTGYKNNTLSLAYQDKNYGAYDFYTPGKNMPSREFLITRYAALDLQPWEFLSIKPYYRYHYDKFILNNDNPSYYQNRHNTAVYGADVKAPFKINDNINARVKAGLRREEIQSSSFNNHYRASGEADAAVSAVFLDDFTLYVQGVLASYNTIADTEFMHSASLEWKGLQVIKLYAGYSQSARYPSFTELYYSDPFTQGSSGLKPERNLECRAGLNMDVGAVEFSAGGMLRYSQGLIDWGKENVSDLKWTIANRGESDTASLTFLLKMPFSIFNLSAGHTYTDSYSRASYIPKYGANYLKNKFFASVDFQLYGVTSFFCYTHKNYDERNDAFNSFDASLSYVFGGIVTASLKCENIANMYYEEIKGIPAPGRVIKASVLTEF